ncbi:hypothetical protein GRI89_01350 [Altererythrobacter salegens]|uniref:Uncharacterized protein n=1 Tax=Croceibacterium salegens TaxID=1737568 RepID=A0A6I4SQI0_9SPHN|nr:hypothetical protein [Croceibacterium salegens]MXO58191.1 hypothetical protein [Croceibacterium salegens]
MSKQLSISASISVFVTAVFVLMATPNLDRANDTGATNFFAAPAIQVSLPTR